MNLLQILFLAIVQGAAELLPVSSSAHVIVAEKLMGLDPSAPEMTFLLVMLHTGTMIAVLFFFGSRWKKWDRKFVEYLFLATAITGVVGLGLKKIIEKVVLEKMMGVPHGEIESLFKSLPLIGVALFMVGILILIAGRAKRKTAQLSTRSSAWIGLVQGLCLPFRGFSRSGATISTALLSGVKREVAEDFSFALAVLLTPPVVLLELHRLLKAWRAAPELAASLTHLLFPGFLGMLLSFVAGLGALYWLSSWLEKGRWKYFGFYCILASLGVFGLTYVGF